MEKEKDTRFCPCCEMERPLNLFILDFRQKNKFLPMCRFCTDKIVSKTMKQFDSMAAGVWQGAMLNNVPMIQEVWDRAYQTIIETEAKSPFAIYYRALRDIKSTYTDVSESDCWLGSFVKLFPDEEHEDEEEIFSAEELTQLFKDWGKFVDDNGVVDFEAYQYLTQRFDDYTDGINDLTIAMSSQFRNLCKAEWQKLKADESGDINEIAKAQKLVDNLLSVLKLDDFAVEKSDTDRFIDRLIWRIEETAPAEEEDESLYVDIAGYENMYNSLMRSMKNMLTGSRDFPEIPPDEV